MFLGTKSELVSAPRQLPFTVPAAQVAQAILTRLSPQVGAQAVCLRTAVPKRVALDTLAIAPAVRAFIARYEPTVAKHGLYRHQAKVVNLLSHDPLPHVVLTTSTGSGKSLAMWAFLLQAVSSQPDATGLACFPTQALLWGQIERLRRCSIPESLIEYDGQVYGGELVVQKGRLGWTAWHGTQGSPAMTAHERSPAFKQAHLRLTTVDKAHWSLMQGWHADFLRRLTAVALDEAHSWHGLVGANVRALLDRIHFSLELYRMPPPAYFLASATLGEPREFAAQLCGQPASSFQHVADEGATQVAVVPAIEVPLRIERAAAESALLRYVLLLQPGADKVTSLDLVGNPGIIGPQANALCFVQSKFAGHCQQMELRRRMRGRVALAYDADLPPEQRRRLERQFLQGTPRGLTIIGTSALELGVDLPDLDVVVQDELPTRRQELLQRLGRVGRKVGSPGLAVLCLDYSPLALRLTEAPAAALGLSAIPPVSLPLHLEQVRLRAMRATFEEWSWRLGRRMVSDGDFSAALQRHFAESPRLGELEERIKHKLGRLLDLSEEKWFYRGFRVSASEGKCPLILEETGERVAVIESTALIRDAHPEGVYLGYRGERYRAVDYKGGVPVRRESGKQGEDEDEVQLGTFLKSLDAVIVRREQRRVATRGQWEELFTLMESVKTPGKFPRGVKGHYGIWQLRRRFDGYLEIDLGVAGRRQLPRLVTLEEVMQRCRAARVAGQRFPFLHEFSYSTLGWCWALSPKHLDDAMAEALAPVLSALLAAQLCDAVECARSDLMVELHAEDRELRVLDTTPGGSGLSEALLCEGRVKAALQEAERNVQAFIRRPAEQFARYLGEVGPCESGISAKEAAAGLASLARAW